MKWILLLGVLLFFTNPSVEKHKSAVAEELIEIFNYNGELDLGSFEVFAIELMKTGVDRKDYYLFSLTKMKNILNEDSEPIIIGIGILGQVYLFPQVKQGFKEGSKEVLMGWF